LLRKYVNSCRYLFFLKSCFQWTEHNWTKIQNREANCIQCRQKTRVSRKMAKIRRLQKGQYLTKYTMYRIYNVQNTKYTEYTVRVHYDSALEHDVVLRTRLFLAVLYSYILQPFLTPTSTPFTFLSSFLYCITFSLLSFHFLPHGRFLPLLVFLPLPLIL